MIIHHPWDEYDIESSQQQLSPPTTGKLDALETSQAPTTPHVVSSRSVVAIHSS